MTIMTRKSYFFEDLELGMEASVSRTVSEADIVGFADVTGDRNPVHLDADYAARTMFKERIAHGMLTASYISAVFGMELPGPGVIYISQTLNFRAPVKIGDEVVAKVKIAELFPAKRRALIAPVQ
jgi:3-hydroxybutyryl-CoA dehydratase